MAPTESKVSASAEPTVGTASAAGWQVWLIELLTAGRARLASVGVALLLGFAAGVAMLYLFAGLADFVSDGESERIDTAVLLWLRQFQSPALDTAAWFCSLLGSELLAVFLVVALGVFVVHRRWGAAVALLSVTAGAQLLNNVLKDVFQRTRPAPVTGLIPVQAFSFPSGHAMVAAAFYAFIAYVAWRVLRGRVRAASLVVLGLVVILIGLSRLYLGVHYFTDVIAGYLSGFVWADAIIVGGALLARRRRHVTAVASPPTSASGVGAEVTTGASIAPVAHAEAPRPNTSKFTAEDADSRDGDGWQRRG